MSIHRENFQGSALLDPSTEDSVDQNRPFGELEGTGQSKRGECRSRVLSCPSDSGNPMGKQSKNGQKNQARGRSFRFRGRLIPPKILPCRATRSLKTDSRAFRRATPTHAPRRTHVTRANRSTMGGQTIDCVRTSPPISRALATSQPRTTRANRRLPRNCSHACSRNSRSNRAPSRHPRTTVADVPFSPTHRRAIASRSPRSPPATARTCSRARSRTSTSRRRV